MNVKRTVYSVGDMYRRKAINSYWVLTKILPERQASLYVLSRNGVHRPLTSEELANEYDLYDTEGS
jgi:hypothetical protein